MSCRRSQRSHILPKPLLKAIAYGNPGAYWQPRARAAQRPGDLSMVDFVPGLAGPDHVLYWSQRAQACFIGHSSPADPSDSGATLQGPLDDHAVATLWDQDAVVFFLSEAYYGPAQLSAQANPFVLMQVAPAALAAHFTALTGQPIARAEPLPIFLGLED